MKTLDLDMVVIVVVIVPVMYLFALAGAQFMTRFFKLKQKEQPKKIWKFALPTKQEMFYALLAVIGLIIYMLKAGLFD